MKLTLKQQNKIINLADLYADARNAYNLGSKQRVYDIQDCYHTSLTEPLRQALADVLTTEYDTDYEHTPLDEIPITALEHQKFDTTLQDWYLEQLDHILNPTPDHTLTITDPGCGWHDSNKAITQHHAVNRRLKQAWRNKAHTLALHYTQQRKPWEPITNASITYIIHRTSNRHSDADNTQPACKAIRDGLVNAGLLTDDHDGIITQTAYRRGPNKPTPTVTVHIHTT